MKHLFKSFPKKGLLPLFLVIFFGLLAGRGLIGKGYFNMHDDLQMMRQLEMEKCFTDGQIPCRWVPDMGYGFGFPLFNFYPPLPYLIGQGIRLFDFSFVDTAKALFVLSFVVSGVAMYALGKEFFGKLGGVVSSVFYLWAPYHAVDVYVRGAMNEAWAMAVFPLILWTSYRLIKEKQKSFKWLVGLALSYFALFVSHNLMVIIFTPVFALWVLLWLTREKSWHKVPQLIFAGIWALALAAFFTIPALVENKFTQVAGVLVGYYDFTAHFVTIKQLLISRFWGYGPSVWGDVDDGMSFQVGHVHWIGSIIIMAALLYGYWKKKKISDTLLVVGLMFVVGWVSAFLTHSRSTPIWLAVKPLAYLQFSWRFLTLITLAFSFIAGALVTILQKRFYWIIGLLIIGLLYLNWHYFIPEHGKLGALSDAEKFTGAAWELQQTAGIYDYLPATAITAPKEPMKNLGELVNSDGNIVESDGVFSDPMQGTSWATLNVNVEDDSIVRLGIFQFPGWETRIDGELVEPYVPEVEQWGRMWVDVPTGKHLIEAKFVNTPVRAVSNYISLMAWGLFGILLVGRSGILRKLSRR
ncbi:hypothetical protein A3F62_00340 [Candidatus Woesebacteria bacterium RIFCSPHIGHO2_12_FULL_44_11]|nr:MAG: hypothetical protein A3F62_00340 [Candidatus Woesebacteria bacterium RIFCSPHIGHO2_12_FULL_44_11]